MLMVLLPLATLITVRYAGWLKMRKTDREIKAFLVPLEVSDQLDTLRLRGRNIVFLKTSIGERKNKALIFVHGSPGSLDAFLEYMADTALLARADLFSYDRPGFGNSDFGMAEPLLSGQGEILMELMESLGYSSYWLAGHSYGAPVILQVAIRHPEKIAGMSMISGSICPELESASVSWRKWIDLPLVRELLPVSMRVSNEELMSLRQDLILLEDDWDRIDFPVSLIHGKKDVLVPFDNLNYAEEQLTRADTVFTKVFEGESHFILWTHKNEIVTELVRLMDFRK
jgi:pimeloyl-ACP methyl ester carboxylesterase